MSSSIEKERAGKHFKLGKRATSHPPAVSELPYLSRSAGDLQESNRDEQKHNVDEDDEAEYPRGLKLVFITVALCCSVFIVTLDQTIIATAIPKITAEFDSLDDVGWYGSAYLLVTASFQLPYGKFYSIFSIKWTFLIAVGIFEIGSLICALAPSSIVLIIGRAIAGLGCAGIFSGALIIATYTMALKHRPVYVGMLGAISGVAAIIGPLLGGAFTDRVSWRWCFYINLPIGGFTIAFIALLTPQMQSKRSASMSFMQCLANLDILGICFFIPSIICCLLALEWGGSTYAWKSAHVIALFVTSFVLFLIFNGIQLWKKENATLPPRILRQRSVAGAAVFSFTIGATFFVATYYLPIWFQAIKGATAIQSGIDNLPMVLGVVIISVVVGGMITAWGYYTPFMIACSIVTAVGIGCLTTLKVDTTSPKWIGFQALFGIGIGFGLQQPLMTVQTVLDLTDIPTGTAVVVFTQTLGGAIMLLTAQNVFQNELLSNLAVQVPDLDPQQVLSAGATDLRRNIESKYLTGVLKAYNDAVMAALYVPTAMAALSLVGALVTEWKSVKGRKLDMVAM